MFEKLLENWKEPTRRGQKIPYIAFGRVEVVEMHQPKKSKDDPDVWIEEEKEMLTILDLSGNHADPTKIQYYIRKGLVPIKWKFPTGENDPDREALFSELSNLCENARRTKEEREELAKYREAKNRSALDEKVEEAKSKNERRKDNTAAN